jgi:hypothetical protein
MARLGTAVSAAIGGGEVRGAHTQGERGPTRRRRAQPAAEQLEHAAFNGAIDRLPALAEHLTRSMEDVLAALASPPFRGGCPI